MIGKLDPEENVMDECVSGSSWISDLHKALDALQWKHGENIAVEIGGTSVYEIDGVGTKWAVYQKVLASTIKMLLLLLKI